MKRSIIISINPEHVENIIHNIKKFEYRKRVAKEDIDKIIIYETAPEKKVIAEAEIIEVMKMSPLELWNKTKEYAGITKDFFDKYFEGRKVACAYRLGEVKVYDSPKELSEFGLRYAPQSYAYVG